MFIGTGTFFIWKGELTGYSLDVTGFSIVRGRLMITCPLMIFMRTSITGIVKYKMDKKTSIVLLEKIFNNGRHYSFLITFFFHQIEKHVHLVTDFKRLMEILI